MKIPESVRIGGVEYEVQYQENLRIDNDLCYGYISYDNSTITLSSSDGTGHQRRCVTLWHEILHGIQEHSGIPVENEEEVMQDNGRRLFDLKDAP